MTSRVKGFSSSFNWYSTSRSRKQGLERPLIRLLGRFNCASSSRSRKQRAQRTSGNALASLQLGLDLAVEETLKDAREAKLAIALQLGLDLAVEETPRILARPGMSHVASIGPRPRGRGNSKHALARMVDEGASIGPRPRGRGNLAAAGKVAPNEKLQLGLDLAVEETMGCRLTPRPPSPRFNWASTSRSRKPAMVEPGATVDLWLQLGLDLAVEETPAG